MRQRAVARQRAGAPLDLARDLTNRAVINARAGEAPAAEERLRRALGLLTYFASEAPTDVQRCSNPVLAAQARLANSPKVKAATAEALAALGSILVGRGDFLTAEVFLRDAVRKTEHAPSGAHRGNLAVCLIELDKAAEAVTFARMQLELDVKTHGDASAVVAADEDTLATALDLDDKPDEATTHGKRAIALATTLLGEDHPTTRAYVESWGGD